MSRNLIHTCFLIRFDPPLDVPMVPAAPLGFHNREVLGDVLGYEAAVIDDLERRRVVSDGPARRAG